MFKFIAASLVFTATATDLGFIDEPQDNSLQGVASFTWYSSYAFCCPDNPNYDPKASKEECDDYSACEYAGDFAAIGHKSFDYVKSNNLVAFYDNSDP